MLAERFATKCFTPLELTHFKDNFFSRATDQAGFRYWNEKTLSDFLGIPDGSDSPGAAIHDSPLDAGPVIFRMASYLGAFPFQNALAPSVLTFEAMVKVVVLLTERYGKVLRRARKDRIKLLFGSLADVGRKDVGQSVVENGQDDKDVPAPASAHAPGFAVDEPANDEYGDEDEDDLALAALESLDAIQVFKHDRRIDKTVYEARISRDTFRRLLMLLVVISPLRPLESVRKYTSDLSANRMEAVRKAADSILAAFIPEDGTDGIDYQQFANVVSSSLPYLFDPLTPLFDHLLFSENLDLSQKREAAGFATETLEEMPKRPRSPPTSVILPGSFQSSILNSSVLSHISFFLSSTSSDASFIRSGVCLHPVFSTVAHGSSLTSFAHHVLTWQSATLLVLQGSITDPPQQAQKPITLGAYMPHPWKSSSKPSDGPLPCLFQLSPKHLLLQGNSSPSAHSAKTPDAYFSKDSGIAIGCKIPPSSRSHQTNPTPHGGGSLLIDTSLETATFHVSSVGHHGVFLPPATSTSPSNTNASTKTTIDIYTLEIWGLVPDESASSAETGQSAVDLQRARWEFEASDAERRRSVNFKAAGDSSAQSARWLLESAGLIGGPRSGGSV